jgi:hypothetical protein
LLAENFTEATDLNLFRAKKATPAVQQASPSIRLSSRKTLPRLVLQQKRKRATVIRALRA